MRIAVLFDNLGPYHRARLATAARVCDLLAVEFGATSGEYAWQRGEKPPFEHRCVNPQGQASLLSRKEFHRVLASILVEFRPDVLAIPGWSKRGAFLAMGWAESRGIPVIVMSDSTEWDEPRKSLTEAIKRRYLRGASAGFVAGKPHRDYLAQLGVSREQIALGYDVVDNGYFSQRADAVRETAVSCRERFGLPKQYFLASARFITKKNLPVLLEAYSGYRQILPSETCPWELVLLGDGELRPVLEEIIRAEQLEGHVHLPGFKQYDELPVYYGLANAFIHASTTEQWGLVVNEAMASGLPLIISRRCGCARDLVRQGVNGWTFNPFSKEELTASLLKMSSLPDDVRKTMGFNSREIIDDWGPECFANGLTKAAELAVSRGPSKLGVINRVLVELLSRRK